VEQKEKAKGKGKEKEKEKGKEKEMGKRTGKEKGKGKGKGSGEKVPHGRTPFIITDSEKCEALTTLSVNQDGFNPSKLPSPAVSALRPLSKAATWTEEVVMNLPSHPGRNIEREGVLMHIELPTFREVEQ